MAVKIATAPTMRATYWYGITSGGRGQLSSMVPVGVERLWYMRRIGGLVEEPALLLKIGGMATFDLMRVIRARVGPWLKEGRHDRSPV